MGNKHIFAPWIVGMCAVACMFGVVPAVSAAPAPGQTVSSCLTAAYQQRVAQDAGALKASKDERTAADRAYADVLIASKKVYIQSMLAAGTDHVLRKKAADILKAARKKATTEYTAAKNAVRQHLQEAQKKNKASYQQAVTTCRTPAPKS